MAFVTFNYPSEARPYSGAFVRNFVRAFARRAVQCTVINPVSIFHRRYGRLDPVVSHDSFVPDNPVEIHKPRYISASSRDLILFNTDWITQSRFHRAVVKTMGDLTRPPDALYGHFIFPPGGIVATLGCRMGIPSIVGVGEDTEEDFVNRRRLFMSRWDITKVSGCIAVSSFNSERCIRELGISREKVLLLPNGVDFSIFYPRNRFAMRRKYGFPRNKTIIAFTGHFEERKGPDRVLRAVAGEEDIGVILIGAGRMHLTGKNILFKGALDHSKIPEMLSASDIFVLPTYSEGSCNAVLEAMACGLPVISSSGQVNEDILNDDVSIRVDPGDISRIREAILLLHRNGRLRQKMSESCLVHVKKFDVDARAGTVLEWINELRRNNGSGVERYRYENMSAVERAKSFR